MPSVVLLLLLPLHHTFYFHSVELLQRHNYTPLELLQPADVPFGDYKTETKDVGGIFGCKIDFGYSRTI